MDRVRTELVRRLPDLLDDACRPVDAPCDPEAVATGNERRCARMGAEGELAPSVVAVVGAQLRMVRVLALCWGVDLDPTRLLRVAAGVGGGGPLQQGVERFAEQVVRTLERSLAVRALPSLRGPAVALWGASSTASLARRTRALVDGAVAEPALAPVDDEAALAQRLVVLSNLTKAARPARAEDRALLGVLLGAAALPEEIGATLLEAFGSPRQHPADFATLGTPEEALALGMDLVALAWREGEPDRAERAYAVLVAAKVGVPLGVVLER